MLDRNSKILWAKAKQGAPRYGGPTHPELLDPGKWRKGNISHTNTIHVLAPNTAGPAFAKGNILTSMTALGLIAVLDT